MKKEKQKQGVIDKQDLTIIENSEAYELNIVKKLELMLLDLVTSSHFYF